MQHINIRSKRSKICLISKLTSISAHPFHRVRAYVFPEAEPVRLKHFHLREDGMNEERLRYLKGKCRLGLSCFWSDFCGLTGFETSV